MPNWWMTSPGDFLITDRQDQGPIHCQGVNGCSTACRAPLNSDSLPAKVLAPDIASRMEQSHLLSAPRISSGLTSGFAQGARDTGKRKSISGVLPACADRNDVVDVEGRLLAFL
jgi:hypothetical protein